MQAFIIDAFTDTRFEGNTAGVVLDAESYSTAQKQKIAAEINAAETAFVSRSEVADFKVEFFTPKCAIDFCGHATVAAFHVLAAMKRLEVGDRPVQTSEETHAGIVPICVSRAGEAFLVEMTQRAPQVAESQWAPNEVARALGISESDIGSAYPIKLSNTGNWHLIVPVTSTAVLDNISCDAALLGDMLKQASAVTAHIFCAGEGNLFHARNFGPHVGIPEDPATGSAAGAFCGYLATLGMLPDKTGEIQIHQGEKMGRLSRIKAVHMPSTGEVKVSGIAVTSFVLANPHPAFKDLAAQR
jgi:trans-2,3-dihydro-3-hydroxyanthranilate isomerase